MQGLMGNEYTRMTALMNETFFTEIRREGGEDAVLSRVDTAYQAAAGRALTNAEQHKVRNKLKKTKKFVDKHYKEYKEATDIIQREEVLFRRNLYHALNELQRIRKLWPMEYLKVLGPVDKMIENKKQQMKYSRKYVANRSWGKLFEKFLRTDLSELNNQTKIVQQVNRL